MYLGGWMDVPKKEQRVRIAAENPETFLAAELFLHCLITQHLSLQLGSSRLAVMLWGLDPAVWCNSPWQ